MQFKKLNYSVKNLVAFFKRHFHFEFSTMPLFSVNMAVPVKESVRESRIYFLASTENVPQESRPIDRKYLVFKSFEMITALCALMLFAYGMRATENEIKDMLKYVTLGVVTIYPLLFILLSIDIKQRPIFSLTSNTLAMVALFIIGATTFSSSWSNKQQVYVNEKDKYPAVLMQIRSSCLLIVSGLLYFIESLVMSVEIGKICISSS